MLMVYARLHSNFFRPSDKCIQNMKSISINAKHKRKTCMHNAVIS